MKSRTWEGIMQALFIGLAGAALFLIVLMLLVLAIDLSSLGGC